MTVTGDQVVKTSPLFSTQRALEAVQAIDGLWPVRLITILYPLWEVEITGRQERSFPYELLEQFVVRGIVDGKLLSADELSTFFGLDRGLVDKILTRLQTLDQVRQEDGIFIITELGHKSLKEGVIHRNLETRRKLYFEACDGKPLPQRHYKLHIMSEIEAKAYSNHHMKRFYHFWPWQPNSLHALVQQPERSNFNLPDEVIDPQVVAVTPVYLPMYIIEAHQQNNLKNSDTTYVVLNRLQGLRDDFFEDIINSGCDIINALYADAMDNVKKLMEGRIARWGISEHIVNLNKLSPDSDLWRVVVASAGFQRSGMEPSLVDIGKFKLVKGYCLQIWSNDRHLRRRAAYEQALTTIMYWQRPATQQTVDKLLEGLASRLETGKLTLAELWKQANKNDASEVMDKLKEFL